MCTFRKFLHRRDFGFRRQTYKISTNSVEPWSELHQNSSLLKCSYYILSVWKQLLLSKVFREAAGTRASPTRYSYDCISSTVLTFVWSLRIRSQSRCAGFRNLWSCGDHQRLQHFIWLYQSFLHWFRNDWLRSIEELQNFDWRVREGEQEGNPRSIVWHSTARQHASLESRNHSEVHWEDQGQDTSHKNRQASWACESNFSKSVEPSRNKRF